MEILKTMKQIFTFLFSMAVLFSQAQPSALRINEVMSSNGSTVLSGYGLYSDWIEFYNTGNQIVDIGGMYISDDALNLTKYRFPFGQSLELNPGGFFLVWADDSANAEHTNFKLSSIGEKVFLVDTNGTSIVDSVTFPALAADQSWGRSVDGTGAFQSFAPGAATPSASNNLLSSGQLKALGHLQVFPNPASDFFSVKGLASQANVEYIKLFASDGSLLKIFTSPDLVNDGFRIDDLSAGVYFVKLRTHGTEVTMPLIRM
jgi:hypothetical protein